jgi:hypothetical protein
MRCICSEERCGIQYHFIERGKTRSVQQSTRATEAGPLTVDTAGRRGRCGGHAAERW